MPGLALADGRHRRSIGARRATTSAFDPLSLSPLLWLKADNGTGGVSDGDAIGTWTDKSGNGHDATQATGSRKPLYKLNIQNSLPVVRFDAVDDVLVASYGSAQAQTNTVFVVANIKANGGNVIDGGAAGSREVLADGLAVAGKIGIFAGSVIETVIAKPTGMSVWTCVFAGASSVLYRDGVSFASGNAGTNSASGITIGASQALGNPLNGDIAEILVYHATLSAPDQTSVQTYLKSKWGTP